MKTLERRGGRFKVLSLLMVLCSGALLFQAGCASDFGEMRRDHAETFPEELAERTARILEQQTEFGLEDCIRIALENNLSVKSAEIQRRLAGLDRNIAFSAFLPQIELQYSWIRTDSHQKINTGAGYAAMADQRLERIAVTAQQPIFMPQTWLVYSMRQKGKDISELVALRTRQMIRLQVASLYYAHLTQLKLETWLNREVAEAEALLRQVSALEREGVETLSSRLNVETLLAARENAVKDNLRLQEQTRSELLEAMGLSPFAQLTLKTQTPLTIEPTTLEADVMEAMLNRPELGIADRTISIRKDETRMAIATFLPNLVGVGAYNYDSDSFVKYSGLWSYGLSGVLSVFDGFKNVFEYKAARERHEEAFVEREQTCMMIMLEVIKARLNLDTANDALALSNKALLAAKEALREAESLEREGWIDTAAKIKLMSARDAAQARVALATFQQQVSTAVALDVLGRSR